MKKRILLRVIALSIIPFLALGMIFYGNSLLKEWRSTMNYTLSQISSLLDSSFRELTLIADNLSIHTVVQSSMSQDGRNQSKNDQIDELSQLNILLRQYENQKTVYDIRLFFSHEKFYTSEQISFFPFSAFEEDEQCRHPASIGQMTGIYKRNYKDKPAAQVVTYYKLIPRTNSTLSTVGALCVDMNADVLSAYLLLPQSGLSTLALLDEEGQVMLLTGEERSMEEYRRAAQVCKTPDMPLSDQIVVSPLGQLNWFVIGWVDAPHAFLGSLSNLFFWIALIVMMVIFLLVVIMVTNAFAKRVELLVQLLAPGAANTMETEKQKSISMLGHLNQSVNHAKQLLDWQKRQVVLQQQTQLKLLQAQINPHFLYNALDCANWLVRDGEQEQASQVILAIGKYYRLVLSKGRDELTVEEDLELAVTYAQIQESRLKRKIQIQVHIQEQAKNCVIPKMTLQPIIENSIMHGFRNLLENARIDIDVYTAEKYLYLVVCDNGMGMSPETAAHLLDNPSNTGSFGLYSVHQRCILFSGQAECGVSVETEQGEYTIVTVKLALRF